MIAVDWLIDRACIVTVDDGQAGPLAGTRQSLLGLFPDGAIAVKGGRVAALGPREAVLASVDPAREFDAAGRVAMPGMVDSHTHPIWAGHRAAEFEQRVGGATYLEIMAAGGGIASTVRATRAASDEQLLSTLLERLDAFMACGSTTVEAKTGYGLSVAEELRHLELLAVADLRHAVRVVPTFLGAHALPVFLPELRDSPRQWSHKMSEGVLILRQGSALTFAVARNPLRRLDRRCDDLI